MGRVVGDMVWDYGEGYKGGNCGSSFTLGAGKLLAGCRPGTDHLQGCQDGA